MALNKKDYVISKVKATIGDAVVPASSEEVAAITNAISFANLKYWKGFPYQYRELFSISINSPSERIVAISAIKEAAFSSTTPRNASYYLGVVRVDQSSKYDLPQFSQIDSYLLGKSVSYEKGMQPSLDKIMLDKTNIELLTGDIDYIYDSVNDTVKYVLPYIEGNISVVHGFGFDDPDLLYLPTNHLDVFSKLATLEFLDIIITARSAIGLEGDFTMNVEFLKEKYDSLKESLEKELTDMSITPIIIS